MAVCVDHVREAVTVPMCRDTPDNTLHTSVCSLLDVGGHRRYKSEVVLRPQLSPVSFSSTCYIQSLTSSRRRYVSRTLLKPRPRPSRYAETTFTAPPATAQPIYVTTVDQGEAARRRRYKQTVHLNPRHFRSTLSVPRATDVNSNALTHIANSVVLSNGYANNRISHSGVHDNSVPSNGVTADGVRSSNGIDDVGPRVGGDQGEADPGASQVFIPKRRDRNVDLLMNGGLHIDFPSHNGVTFGPNQHNGDQAIVNGDRSAHFNRNPKEVLSRPNSRARSKLDELKSRYSNV